MEIIPTQKIINRDGIKAVKNGQKANRYSSVPNQKKPEWIRVKATFDFSHTPSRTDNTYHCRPRRNMLTFPSKYQLIHEEWNIMWWRKLIWKYN